MNGNDSGRHRAYIVLGSNIDAERHLPLAVARLRRFGDVAAVSGVYESPPADGSDQPHYLNAAVLLLTALSAKVLCRESLPMIEHALGRVRDPHDRYAPRTIDLDLALYDNETQTIDHRRIPDPEIAERAYLAIPLAELDGSYRHPTSGLTLAEIAAPHRSDESFVRRLDVTLVDAPW